MSLRLSKQKLSTLKLFFSSGVTLLVESINLPLLSLAHFSWLCYVYIVLLKYREGKTVLRSCPCSSPEGLCKCCKIASFTMLGLLWGRYAVVYSEWTGKPHSCCANVDTCKLQTPEICIQSICGKRHTI